MEVPKLFSSFQVLKEKELLQGTGGGCREGIAQQVSKLYTKFYINFTKFFTIFIKLLLKFWVHQGLRSVFGSTFASLEVLSFHLTAQELLLVQEFCRSRCTESCHLIP